MLALPVANLLHHKLRSVLCSAAVGIGVAMMVVQLSLSHGMLDEVADRMQSVDAELIVLPENANVIFQGGAIFSDRYAQIIESTTLDGAPVARKAIPVFLDTVRLGGQQQRMFGIDPDDMASFLGGRTLQAGTLFNGGAAFKRHVEALRGDGKRYDPETVDDRLLRGACELIIDSRLARVGPYKVGDTATIYDHRFRIVGIVESGVAGRVFAPIQTMRHILNGGVPWSSMFFVKLADPARAEEAADLLAGTLHTKVELKTSYGRLLADSFQQIYLYINIASAVALIVCFLFVMLTMYTLILQRTREIGILKSLGASRRYLVGIAVAESVLICLGGTAFGIALSFAAARLIEWLMPLATVRIEAVWLLGALLVGLVGGALSALYPGYRAARLEPAVALAYE
ncbi:MAG TPA: ABC transporter permease [Phycisphaerae bacterium]|nr:ABC transporter permease [Phycisphaerae bacterium]